MSKPLKRHASIVEYSKEHHYGLLLVWKIRQGLKKSIEPQRILGYVNLFSERELLPHFENEEEYLLPLLSIKDKLRKQVDNEHFQLRELLKNIKKGGNIQTELEEFANLLEAHIRFEERKFFPHMEKEIDLNQLLIPTNKKSSTMNNLDLIWTDNFWEVIK